MDWAAISPSSDMEVLELGCFIGDKYHLSDDAQEKLENICRKLCDPESSKKIRQMIMFRNSMDTDIIPVINAHVEDNLYIYEAMINVLSELTILIEDHVDVVNSTTDSNQYHYELVKFLDEVKNKFTNSPLLGKIIPPAHYILNEDLSYNTNESNIIQHIFRLIINILNIPEPSNTISDQSVSPKSHSSTTVSSARSQRQNQIIWNFFAAGLDKFILLAIEKDTDSNQWSAQILEVISLIFKDQSVSQLESNIKKLLENPDWYEDDSSESNSSFTQEDTSGNEDSSDSNTEEEDGNPKNLKNYNDDDISCQSSDSDSKEPPSKKMCDDCKPSTSMNKTTRTNLKNTVRDIVTYWVAAPSGNTKKDSEVSTESSSDDDDQSTSVPQNKNQPIGPDASSASEIKEIRKKKILKIMYNSRKKHREQSMVDDEDVSRLLTEFTISFIMRGYGNLIQNLRLKLMTEKSSATLTNTNSRFLWLITFFMRFVEDLEVELPVIEPLFSPEIMSYIVYEGLQTFENLMIESKSHNDTAVKKQGSCLHLFVSAIKQILITIHQMEVNAKNSERRYEIHDIILLLMEMSNLRQFHLLLIWKYNLSYQTRCFINDVVMCNHKLLVLFEKVNSSDKFIKEHLDQFARVEVMKQYAYCLETFESNTELLNEAIFTMIHHVSGNLNGHEALLIPEILNTFSNVLENELFLGEKWSDLIEYMIQRFMNNMNENPVDAPPRLLESVLEEDQSSQYSIPYDRIQFIPLRNNKTINNLQWYYSECKNSEDPVGSIIDMYKEAEYETLTRESVLQGLLSYRIITHAQYIKLAIVKPTLTINNSSSDTTSSNPAELGSQRGESESGQDSSLIANENMELSSPLPSESVYVEEIEGLKDLLLSQGKEYLIHWLQEQIIHVILVKTHAKSKGSVEWKEGVLEPIAYYSVFWNEGIPLVPWSLKEESGLQKNYFLMLLKKIGICLPAERHKHFPRIPFDWSIDHLQDIYKKLASDGDLISETKLTRAGKQITNFAKPKIPNMAL